MKACNDKSADWKWPVQEARTQLDTAVQRLETAGFETPDWAAAQHQWRLGQVFWELGDAHHDAAKAAWMQAIAVEGPCQVWQQYVLASLLQAKSCAGSNVHAADICYPSTVACHCSCCCQICVSRICTLNKAFGS